jgi:hypothetical protein
MDAATITEPARETPVVHRVDTGLVHAELDRQGVRYR